MKVCIIDEIGMNTKDGLMAGLIVREFEIPDKLLEKFKVAYEKLEKEEEKSK